MYREQKQWPLWATVWLTLLFLPVAAGAAEASHSADPSILAQLLQRPLVALFAVITAGLMLGRITLAGASLGSSGVIFTGMALGSMGYGLPAGIGSLGLVLFVYCVGITAGPSFFRAFAQQGRDLAKLAIVLVATGALTTLALAKWAAVPGDLAAGLFAGALTSTPALAAASELLSQSGSRVSVGFAIAYPFGVIGVVLFVQLLPRLLGQDLDRLGHRLESADKGRRKISRVLVEVLNPAVIGKKLSEVEAMGDWSFRIPRILMGERLIPVDSESIFAKGQIVRVVCEESILPLAIDHLGRRTEQTAYMDTDHDRMPVVITSRSLVGKTMHEVNPLKQYGVTIARISRHDLDFVPRNQTVLHYGDVLSAVGDPKHLQDFAAAAGHRSKVVDQTDLISLGVGIIAGVALGLVPLHLASGRTLALGLAGGPLLVGLVLGHFGRVGRIVGYLPRASRLLLMELGLTFFLADAGTKGGSAIVSVIREYGPQLLAVGAAVTFVPMLTAYCFATRILRINLLQTLGGISGGMTSTPGLGVITASTDCDIPVISYAAAYPVALILMTLAVQLILTLLS